MKAIRLLKSVILYDMTEDQGIAISNSFESREDFVESWFGNCDIMSGDYKNNTHYLYCYGFEMVEYKPDMVLFSHHANCNVYLYEIE